MTPSVKEYELRINRVMDHVRRHIGDDLNLDLLAGVACFSPYHFHRLFRVLTGETLQEFIRRQRLERGAMRLTYEPGTPVTVIALDLGFGSLSAFTRAFKDHFGCPPSAWSSIQKSKMDQGLRNPGEAGFSFPDYSEEDIKERRFKMIPKIEKFGEIPYVYWRAIGPYGSAEGFIDQAWQRAYAWAGPRGLLSGPWQTFGISWDDPHVTPPGKCRYDACVLLPPGADPAGQNTGVIPGGTFAVFSFQGTKQDLPGFFDGIYKSWLPVSGFIPGEGPCFERYTPASGMDEKTGVFTCDICVPVVPA